MLALGIDIGNQGIKGCVVDTTNGTFVGERHRVDTPEQNSPEKLISRLYELYSRFKWNGPVGIALPAPVRNGIVIATPNMNPAWQDVNAEQIISEMTDCHVVVMNDADAAGIAEVRFGAGKHEKGLIMLLTVGTGIGTALFYNGLLIPNTNLGHIEIKGITAENRASEKARQLEGIKRKMWAKRLEYVLLHYEKLLHPDLFILSGGLSNKADRLLPYVHLRTRLMAATFLNNAGIVGAAIRAAQVHGSGGMDSAE